MIDPRVSAVLRERLLEFQPDWREAWAGPRSSDPEDVGVYPIELAQGLDLPPMTIRAGLTVTTVLEPLRAQPSHRSEMISELRGGERLGLLVEEEDWQLVVGEDRYVGWVHSWVTGPYPAHRRVVGRFARPVGTLWISDHAAASPLLLGSPLLEVDGPLAERGDRRLVASAGGGEGWIRTSDVADFGSESEVSVRRLLTWGRSLSGTPYRWGGRSPMGFDCSGFVQYLATLALRHLPRDASQQVAHGEVVATSADAWERGDLLFFGDPIDHVGIYAGGGRILHCSGRVREEKLGQSPRLEERLCEVRRPWPHLDLLEPSLWGARAQAGEST